MIVVTRLTGPRFAVNPDLLQRVESTPDTILTLIDGTKYIVAETMEEVTALVVAYRARVVAATLAATAGETPFATVTELRSVADVDLRASSVTEQRAAEQRSVLEQRVADQQRPRPEQRPAVRALAAVPEVH